MPRTNQSRTPLAEQHVARRILQERERRDWTYDRLSARMGEAGCAIHASAIFKIEKGNPPRRITVDELVAFASAFDVSVNYLLGSQQAGWKPEMASLTAALEELFRENRTIQEARTAKAESLREVVLADRDSRDAYREWIDEDFTDWPEFLDWSGIARLTRSATRKVSR